MNIILFAILSKLSHVAMPCLNLASAALQIRLS